MNDGFKGWIVIGVIVVAAIVVELGLVGGGLYDFLRIALLIGVALVALVAVGIVVFLIFASRTEGEGKSANPNVTVRRSSDSDVRASFGQVQGVSDVMPENLDELAEQARLDDAAASGEGASADAADALDESEKASRAVKSAADTLLGS